MLSPGYNTWCSNTLFTCTMWPLILFSFMILTASRVAMLNAITFRSKTDFQSSVLPSVKFVEAVFPTKPSEYLPL